MLDWQKLRLEEATIVPPPPRPLAPEPSHRLNTLAAGNGSRLTFSFRPLPYSPCACPGSAPSQTSHGMSRSPTCRCAVPFRYWEHMHLFEIETRANASGVLVQGTLVKDDLEYSPPERATVYGREPCKSNSSTPW